MDSARAVHAAEEVAAAMANGTAPWDPQHSLGAALARARSGTLGAQIDDAIEDAVTLLRSCSSGLGSRPQYLELADAAAAAFVEDRAVRGAGGGDRRRRYSRAKARPLDTWKHTVREPPEVSRLRAAADTGVVYNV